MDLDTFFFYNNFPKIGHSQFGQVQVASIYEPSSIPVSMDHKDQKQCQASIFDLTVSKKNKNMKSPKAPTSKLKIKQKQHLNSHGI